MKFSAITPAYNDEAIISGTIKSLSPFVDRHIILLSQKPYYGEPTKPDRTGEIAESLGCEVVSGYWTLDHHQRNVGLALCQDMDWVIIADSDEMITENEADKLVDFLSSTKSNAVSVNHLAYWKTTDYILKDSYKPIFAVRPFVRFTNKRNVDCCYTHAEDVTIHHLSWCAPKDIFKKIITYSDADLFKDPVTWYREHYKAWIPCGYAKMPHGETLEVIKSDFPQELINYLNNKGASYVS